MDGSSGSFGCPSSSLRGGQCGGGLSRAEAGRVSPGSPWFNQADHGVSLPPPVALRRRGRGEKGRNGSRTGRTVLLIPQVGEGLVRCLGGRRRLCLLLRLLLPPLHE